MYKYSTLLSQQYREDPQANSAIKHTHPSRMARPQSTDSFQRQSCNARQIPNAYSRIGDSFSRNSNQCGGNKKIRQISNALAQGKDRRLKLNSYQEYKLTKQNSNDANNYFNKEPHVRELRQNYQAQACLLQNKYTFKGTQHPRQHGLINSNSTILSTGGQRECQKQGSRKDQAAITLSHQNNPRINQQANWGILKQKYEGKVVSYDPRKEQQAFSKLAVLQQRIRNSVQPFLNL